jgi:hypothetical protein
MSFDRWHPLDGNMIALERHLEDRETDQDDDDDEEPCPVCGEELEFDEDGFAFCPECGWSE